MGGDARTIVFYGFIGLLVAMAIVVFMPKYCRVSKVEGFEVPIITCPDGSKAYYNNEGDLNCCDGQVNGNKCEGEIACTFSETLKDIPFCGQIRVVKYNGPILPFVKEIIEKGSVGGPAQTFKFIIDNWFPLLIKILQQEVPKNISQATLTKVQNLSIEENTWYSTTISRYKKLPALAFEQEAMYILMQFKEYAQSEPIFSNSELLKQKAQEHLCKA